VFPPVDGQFHDPACSLMPPSNYVLDLGGKWRRFTSGCGLQDGHSGSVVFVLRGDRRELFRSERNHGQSPAFDGSDVAGVDRLELVVEDAGDGEF